MNVTWLLPLYVMFCFITFVLSSDGDRDGKYNNCLNHCLRRFGHDNTHLDFPLRLLGWSSLDDCKYKCMFMHTKKRMENGLHILKYHGKWPFTRFLGIQEPASTLFSFFNMLSHVIGWNAYKSIVPTDYEFYHVTRLQFWVNVIGWLGAVIFHTRDLYWTERLDYLGATLIIAISVFSCLCRLVGKVNNKITFVGGILITVLFGQHIYYMNFIKFDYGYNMKFMVCVGICNLLVWLLWCIKNWKQRRYVWKCMFTLLVGFSLAGLEVGDFPPLWWVLDAHSLWHLGTAPLAYLWYQFLINDAVYELEEVPRETIQEDSELKKEL